jgi:hypothetical protein
MSGTFIIADLDFSSKCLTLDEFTNFQRQSDVVSPLGDYYYSQVPSGKDKIK